MREALAQLRPLAPAVDTLSMGMSDDLKRPYWRAQAPSAWVLLFSAPVTGDFGLGRRVYCLTGFSLEST